MLPSLRIGERADRRPVVRRLPPTAEDRRAAIWASDDESRLEAGATAEDRSAAIWACDDESRLEAGATQPEGKWTWQTWTAPC